MPDQEEVAVNPDAEVVDQDGNGGEGALPPRRGRLRNDQRAVKVEVKQTEIVPAGEASSLVKNGAGTRRPSVDPHDYVLPNSRHHAAWLDKNWDAEDKTNWSIEVERHGPSRWERVPLIVKKPIMNGMPLRTFEEIKKEVVEVFGGGLYLIRVKDAGGVKDESLIRFNIPTEQVPPILSDAEKTGGLSNITGSSDIPNSATPPPELSKDVIEAKTRLEKKKVSKEEMELESEMRRKQREEREDDEEWRNRRENKGMAPLKAELDAKFDRFQMEIKAAQTATDSKFERLLDKMDSKPKDDNSIEKTMAAMSTIMAPLMGVLSKRDENQGNKELEAIKAQGEMLKQNFQMMLEMSKASSDKNEKFFTNFIQPLMSQVSKPENPKKAILESMELIKMIREEMTPGEPEAQAPVQYNPEMSPMENMFGAIATWLQKRNAAAGAPPPPYPQMNPPPGQTQARPLETFDLETPNVPLPGIPTVTVTSNTTVRPALPATDTPEARLRFVVTESMRTALKEAKEGALAASWPQDAGTWAPTFLDQVASAPHDGARLDLVKAQCDPRLWTELELYLQSKPQTYRVFMAGLRELVMHVAEAKAPATGSTI